MNEKVKMRELIRNACQQTIEVFDSKQDVKEAAEYMREVLLNDSSLAQDEWEEEVQATIRNLRCIAKTVLSSEARSSMRADLESAIHLLDTRQAQTAPQQSGLPPMPETADRRPYYDDEPDGYLEGNSDWAKANDDAVEWLADNHRAIRATLTAQGAAA